MGERRMERWCAGAIDAAGLARGEMGEDGLDEFGCVDARDDAQRTATDEGIGLLFVYYPPLTPLRTAAS